MSDREKLDYMHEFLRNMSKQYTGISMWAFDFTLRELERIEDNSVHKPTSRACFDKPAGVPIEHWETL